MCAADRAARRQRPARVAPSVGDDDVWCVARRGGPVRCLPSCAQRCPACRAKLCALLRAARGAQHVRRGCNADEHGRRVRLPRKRGAAPASRQPCAAAANAPALLAFAVDGGVNMFDSAEMYPVPQRAETQARRESGCGTRACATSLPAALPLTPRLRQGRSEEYLGRWLREARCRDRVLVSTKVAGPAAMPWLRDGPLRRAFQRALVFVYALTRQYGLHQAGRGQHPVGG